MIHLSYDSQNLDNENSFRIIKKITTGPQNRCSTQIELLLLSVNPEIYVYGTGYLYLC